MIKFINSCLTQLSMEVSYKDSQFPVWYKKIRVYNTIIIIFMIFLLIYKEYDDFENFEKSKEKLNEYKNLISTS